VRSSLAESYLDDLRQRLVAAPLWAWRAGMLWEVANANGVTYGRVLAACEAPAAAAVPRGALPDLFDPATRGGLLDVAREAWDDDQLRVRFSRSRGIWVTVSGAAAFEVGEGESEGVALAQAVLRASRRRAPFLVVAARGAP
jgi:hypothetical protein